MCIHIYIFICMYVYVYIYILYIYMYANIIYVHTFTYMCIYIYIYRHGKNHPQTDQLPRSPVRLRAGSGSGARCSSKGANCACNREIAMEIYGKWPLMADFSMENGDFMASHEKNHHCLMDRWPCSIANEQMVSLPRG